jgi:integrase
MLVEDYLRPAAVKVGVLKEGERVRFGFHNLRHSLASFLVQQGTDPKTVQKMLRHSDVATTLGIYAHSMSEDRLAAVSAYVVRERCLGGGSWTIHSRSAKRTTFDRRVL